MPEIEPWEVAKAAAEDHFLPRMDGTVAPDHVQQAFIDGFAEAVEQLPSRDEIAAVMRRHNFDELMLGDIEWDGYTAACACGWRSDEYKMPGDAHKSHSQHSSAHVLDLIRERYEGES